MGSLGLFVQSAWVTRGSRSGHFFARVASLFNPRIRMLEHGCRRAKQSNPWTELGYPILAFPEVPSIEIMLMERSDPSLGAGEGALPPTSAALANAFARATGRRLRDLPMTPDRVKALLS